MLADFSVKRILVSYLKRHGLVASMSRKGNCYDNHGKFVLPLSRTNRDGWASVYCHFQIIEDQASVLVQFPHLLRYA